jgi:hypothetical protein
MGAADGFGGVLGGRAEAVLQIARDRDVHRSGDEAGIGYGLISGNESFAIGAPELERRSGAGRGQRLEAQRGEELGACGVPRVRDEKELVAFMQGAEGTGFVGLGGHKLSSSLHMLAQCERTPRAA